MKCEYCHGNKAQFEVISTGQKICEWCADSMMYEWRENNIDKIKDSYNTQEESEKK